MGQEDPWQLEGVHDAFLQALLRDTTLAVAVTDATGTISLMSPALQSMIRMPFAPVGEEDMPRHFNTWTEDGSRMMRPEEIPLNRARAGESVRDVGMGVLRDDGVMLHLRCSGTPIRRDDGTIAGAVVLVTDITSERAALLEQQALRDRLVETVNHELRTPLTKLLGHAELLEDLRPGMSSTARRSLDALIEAGHELREMVQTVSELVDLDVTGKVHPEPSDVAAITRRAVAALEARAATRHVTLRTVLPDSAPALVDPKRYRKALAALVDNAVTYAPPGSAVEVEVRVEECEVVADVSDAGPGIPERDRHRLVQPFERGEHPGQPVNSRGLGLAVAHTVAVAHGGTLTLHDREPQGLRASLRVPREAVAVTA